MEGAETIESVELIGNPAGRPEVIAKASVEELSSAGSSREWRVKVKAGRRAFFLRARGCGTAVKPIVDKAGAAWFYTNAVFVEPAGAED